MTLRRDPKSKLYSADIRDRAAGRVHVSLKTKRNDEAMVRHAAVDALIKDGDARLILDLRKQRLNVESLVRCVRDRLPFSSLRMAEPWPSLDAAMDQYLDAMTLRPDRSAGTAKNIRSQFKRLRSHIDSGLRVDQVTTAMVHTAGAEIRAEISAWSVSLIMGRLKGLYLWLQQQEGIAAQETNRPVRPLHIPVPAELLAEVPTPRARFLSREEADRLLAATPDRYRFAVLAGLTCGLRLNEVLTLRRPPVDVDVVHGLVTVQDKEIAPGVLWRPKSKRRRDVPLAGSVVDAALIHNGRYAKGAWMYPGGTVGQPLSDVSMFMAFARIVKDAGLEVPVGDPQRVSFHTLRHTFASWLIMDGTDLFTVSRLMGHSSTAEVESTYGHLSPDHKRRAVQLFDTWLTARDGAQTPLATPEARV